MEPEKRVALLRELARRTKRRGRRIGWSPPDRDTARALSEDGARMAAAFQDLDDALTGAAAPPADWTRAKPPARPSQPGGDEEPGFDPDAALEELRDDAQHTVDLLASTPAPDIEYADELSDDEPSDDADEGYEPPTVAYQAVDLAVHWSELDTALTAGAPLPADWRPLA